MAIAVLVLAVAAIVAVLIEEHIADPQPTLVFKLPGHPIDTDREDASPTLPATAHSATGASSARTPVVLPDVDTELLVDGPYGPLPQVSADGRAPRELYAHPFDGRDDRSRVVIIVADLGLDDARTDAAIRRLPSPVTLAFTPYADDLPSWSEKARAAGHEFLVTLPLEVETFPYRDPGPRALLTALNDEQNLDRLAWTLGRLTGYVGVANLSGDRFETDERAMETLLTSLADRGLIYVEGIGNGSEIVARLASDAELPVVHVDLRIDETPSRGAIDEALMALESVARERAIAVGLVHPYPVTIDRLVAWIETLTEKDLILAPASAVAGRQVRP